MKANEMRMSRVRSNQDILKRNYMITLEREEERQKKILL